MRRPINWITVCISITFLVVGLSLAEPRQHRDVHVVTPAVAPLLEKTAFRADADLASRLEPFAAQSRLPGEASNADIGNATYSYSVTIETAEPLDVRELVSAIGPQRRR
jgi:hypothetical protein